LLPRVGTILALFNIRRRSARNDAASGFKKNQGCISMTYVFAALFQMATTGHGDFLDDAPAPPLALSQK
jgi:hypothetical protein